MVKHVSIDEISFIGGMLCLDYVNSVHDRRKDPPPDYLNSFNDLLQWSGKVGLIDAKGLRLLEAKANQNIKRADSFYRHSIEVRELMYRIFKEIIEKKKISKTDLEKYNQLLKEYFPFIKIKQKDNGYIEGWDLVPDNFKNITAPIIKSTYELILSGEIDRIRGCPNCGWLFFDTTKNGKRRWCSMKTCGSNVKALEYYHRQKEKQE